MKNNNGMRKPGKLFAPNKLRGWSAAVGSFEVVETRNTPPTPPPPPPDMGYILQENSYVVLDEENGMGLIVE